LAGVGDGISTVGDGIKAWAATPDQKEIDRLTEDILKSEFKDDYNTLLQGVESLNAEKVHAVAAVASSMQQINDCTTSISRNLITLTALSDQRQSLEQALDAGVRQYLGSMQQRARDRLLWYQYNFAQAYKYETLLPPGDDFLNLDDWIERLQKAKRGEDWTPGSDVVLSKDDFQAAEEAVVKDQLLELAKSIVAQRQKYAALTTNDFDCALTSDQCEMLRTQGRVTFNLIRDFQKGSLHDVQAKIVDLTLEGFTLASTDATLSLDVEFRHSGESVILDHSDTYYSFRCALDDDPIGWGYVYNQSKVTHPVNGAEPFSKDQRLDPEIDQMLADTKIAYQEYFPSFFSDITLWLNRGDHTEQAKLKAQLDKITAISEVRFSVKVARSR
jgi:hypothetical protein